MQATERKKFLLRVATLLVMALVLYFVVGALRRDGPAALEAWRTARVRWSWVGIATVLAFVGPVVSALGWQRLLIDLGVPVRFGWVLRLFLVSNLGRYLPGGKAWQLGIVAMMSTERGLPAALVTGSSFLLGIVGMGVGAILLLPLSGAMIGGAAPLFALGVAGLEALLALPAILRRTPRLRAQLARRVPGIDTVTSATMWAVTWTAAVAWCAWGVALYALAWALLPSPGAPLALYVAAWIGSFLAGLLAVFSPGGLGVREGAMQTALVAAGVTTSSALLVVIVVRVFQTVLEIVPALILLVLGRRSARPDAARAVPADAVR